MNRLNKKTISIFLTLFATVSTIVAEPIRVLIVDGPQKYHKYEETTPVLKEILEKTNRFTVDLSRSTPESGKDGSYKPEFRKYDVIVVNEGFGSHDWPKATQVAFEDYMKNGGGMVSYHAANNAWPNWVEYNKMTGVGGWSGRDEKSGPYLYINEDGEVVRDMSPGRGGSHGPRHTFEIVVREQEHPIMKGLPERFAHGPDELYDRLRGPAENVTILATAYSSKNMKGTGRHEPVLMTLNYGSGRIFHTVLGHSIEQLRMSTFVSTFQRGTEWAATGEVTIPVPDDLIGATGEAVLKIMSNVDNVQRSNYGKNSFQLSNTGGKNIVEFELDVSNALFPDSVFDPEGLAGDSVAKPLQINSDMTTGVIPFDQSKKKVYIGEGGTKGYRGLRITFDTDKDDGFNPGESIGFSIDMDPNSIAGTRKKPLDQASAPKWDVGGISGAELIGSTFIVTFEDGTKAKGQLFSTATQAGSQGIATQQPRDIQAQLTVNGMEPGETGSYSEGGPKILVSAPAGQIVRVVVAKGFIQPVTAYDKKLHKQLEALSKETFPANNAVEFQFADLKMTDEAIDVSDRFDFTDVEDYNFSADPNKPFSIDEDKVSLAIVAAVIDPENQDLILGPVTKPIYLSFR